MFHLRDAAKVFQSTLPVWGATIFWTLFDMIALISIHAPRVGSDVFTGALGIPRKISIHAPRVGSDYLVGGFLFLLLISIHAPRVGSDLSLMTILSNGLVFQSTLPVWGATCPGGDYMSKRSNFNPRSPCGERPG